MFRPLAYTKTFAMASATVLSITLVPALMTIFLRGRRLKPEAANPFYRLSIAIYEPVLRAALRWKWTTLLVNMAVVPLTIPLIFLLGSEFMPPLYEGSLLYMPTSPPGHVDHRRHAAAAGAGQADQAVPRGGARLRHDRPRHDADGQLADGDGEHDHRAEAEARVAGGNDLREAPGGDGRGAAVRGISEHLDATDPEPARYALHGHQDAGRHQDPRARPGCDSAPRTAGRGDPRPAWTAHEASTPSG